MSDGTGIQWTDATWNPIRGCSRVSEGCRHCYAETVAKRFGGAGMPYEALTNAQGRWNGTIRVVEEHLTDPLRWTRPRRVFVNSMSDLFHEAVSDETIDRIFAVMALAPKHIFQVLTKRPERMRAYMSARPLSTVVQDVIDNMEAEDDCPFNGHAPLVADWPLPNVWLGVSVEDQATADARIPLLLQTPAAVRFISAEPLLGPIDASPYLVDDLARIGRAPRLELDWVIVGGESGPGARPCDVAWVRSLVRQCAEARVACFVKQLGGNIRDRNDAGFLGEEADHWPEHIDIAGRVEHDLDGTRDGYQGAPVRVHLHDRKGGDMAEWPEDLRVRQFPSPSPSQEGARG